MIDISASGHYVGDCRELLAQLPEACVQSCVTSPPYWRLRDYGHAGQIGLEATPDLYVAAIVEVFRGVRRALKDDGTIWVNLGDSYYGTGSGAQGPCGQMAGRAVAQNRIGQTRDIAARSRGPLTKITGVKSKDLVGIPWLVAFALRADGWYLRSDIIWAKPNPMPESVRDRPTKAHEYLFLLSKGASYYYDADAVAEPAEGDHGRNSRLAEYSAVPGAAAHRGIRCQVVGRSTRNLRSVWTVASQPYSGAHFAVFPPRLIEPCILAGSRPGDIVLDPFFGSGTTGQVAEKHGRRWIGFDLGYADLAQARTAQRTLPMGTP